DHVPGVGGEVLTAVGDISGGVADPRHRLPQPQLPPVPLRLAVLAEVQVQVAEGLVRAEPGLGLPQRRRHLLGRDPPLPGDPPPPRGAAPAGTPAARRARRRPGAGRRRSGTRRPRSWAAPAPPPPPRPGPSPPGRSAAAPPPRRPAAAPPSCRSRSRRAPGRRS